MTGCVILTSMDLNINDFIAELNRWKITISEKYPRIVLAYGNKRAREHYTNLLRENPEIEANLIYELSKSDADLRYAIEERAAIREFEAGLSGDLIAAILGNFTN